MQSSSAIHSTSVTVVSAFLWIITTSKIVCHFIKNALETSMNTYGPVVEIKPHHFSTENKISIENSHQKCFIITADFIWALCHLFRVMFRLNIAHIHLIRAKCLLFGKSRNSDSIFWEFKSTCRVHLVALRKLCNSDCLESIFYG